MLEKTFLDKLESNSYSKKDLSKVKEAIEYSKQLLSSKKRLAGDSVFDHNLRMANLLIDNGADPEIIIAAIIYKIPDFVSEKEVQEKFGKEIINLIKSAKDITQLKTRNMKLNAENLRKVLLATVNDVRVILIKLVDKLDNQKDIHFLAKDEQKRISQEILDVYAPLASRLGAEKIKADLEDLAFKTINPKKYQEIVGFLERSREDRVDDVKQIIKQIKSFKDVNIIKIKGRPKHIYSIYKKITKRGVKLNEQYDLLGIRAIVSNEKECYHLLGWLHEKFEPIDGKLKDYIANPKPNGYQSIHTSLIVDGKKKLEVQIRTPEMDENAEEGVAAHWGYKGQKADRQLDTKLAWVKNILELHKDSSAREFIEDVKLDVFADQIYCYTPKGDIKYMPLGSTILDFAYMVHEQIGNHCVGARVNGNFASLRSELNKGDVVEILTSKKQIPRRNWIKFVKTSRAKSKVKKGIRLYQGLPAIRTYTLRKITKEEYDSLTYAPEYKNASCTLAKCCRPVPKENLAGIITKRRMISVHREDCDRIENEESRWIKVDWKETFNKKIKFYVVAKSRSGLLADLLHTIATVRFEVKEAKAKLVGNNSTECSFLIIPKEIDELEKLVVRLKKVEGVKKIFFE
ncbi:bifunctional (p)ppGpp synthetase/guanosine-3',5'-bis(diphosphate) 3'-pyrophosphohydrolase [archaeon]|mgnify:CR=1 FL=1|jgi:GTP diphosphokinase / guanosine-3',5'-bis(diphosphate) 3'-diphosphatase|nr:bifunctional (p)ppGpp synthetase/guanosine-3',5'-bis(diphosphate) 3'-pyrophosphohydrolase [archaeon]MBT3451128.1 bifunctional (p)ppGpp synthetase/guanosine-3',5'-bis(diphosphate) 3'-pyrophosphohydrolase [archaeon]MBT6869532.1 bifunctional (p)ppGpp synthetase/guanosine-3',5'-bis(diphosphate) 3'-pyrophosphohydrolase [archaeon]MBT7193697.1 bifunctional (p)ppGpp synthetase/guanosine-3',5'-bis(diphosphate) 3'-pyrophosphohydrolase [archaeon]MBT7380388.1 bifunctional (p)ppGpp synthetase/guanosine-3